MLFRFISNCYTQLSLGIGYRNNYLQRNNVIMSLDVKEGQKLIKKIQYLMDGLEVDSNGINPVEKDLMLGYIRSLYELFLFDKEPEIPRKNRLVKPPKPMAEPIPKKRVRKVIERKPAEPIVEEVVRVEEPEPIRIIEPEPIVELVVEKPDPAKQPDPEPVYTPATPTVLGEHEELFAFKKATDLAGKLQDQPVTDLSKAFSINDRMLTIDKLFKGDEKAFKETLQKLNGLTSFDEAKVYLSHHLVSQFNWMAKVRFKTAKIFVKMVRRRYL